MSECQEIASDQLQANTVVCFDDDPEHVIHWDKDLGIYWFKRGADVREPRGATPDPPLAEERRFLGVPVVQH